MKNIFKLLSRTTTILYTLSIIISIIPVPILAETTTDYTLASNERVVKSYAELSNALASNNGITTVYFGANITMTGGIAIHSSKTDVVISGINPLDPNQTTPYTLTDYSSAAQTSTIYINNSGVKSLLVTDLNIVGKNYYGSFSAYDTTSTDGLVMTYQRVSYSGPEMGYHRRGLIRFIDCYASINGNNGGSENQEFSEAKYLRFEGVNTIDFYTVSWAIFWHTNLTASSHGTFEVADDSSLTVTANSRSSTAAAYGAFAGLGGYVDITIGENAVFNMETSGSMNGLSSLSPAYFSSFTIKNSGAFNLTTTKTGTSPVMQMNGNLFIEDNASFKIDGYGSSTYAEIVQREGNITVSKNATFHLIAGGSYPALLRLYGVSLLCNDPASVLLYNTGGRTIESVTTAGKLHVEAEQVNNWIAAGTGGNQWTLSQWKKADGSNFVIDGTITVGASGNFSSLTSNFSVGDSPGVAPSSTTLNIASARVLSFGRLDLIIYGINEMSAVITGMTAPGAAVLASYTQDGVDHIMPSVVADIDGFFSIPLDTSIVRDTIVIVRSNINYLTAVSSVSVSPAGKVELIVPDYIGFENTGLASSVQMAGRSETAWSITVTDTRGSGSSWQVYARAPVPLTFMNSSGPILNSALVFADHSGAVTPLDTTVPLLIDSHTATSDIDVTIIHWAADRGILARIPPNAVLAGKYTGTIEWILADTP